MDFYRMFVLFLLILFKERIRRFFLNSKCHGNKSGIYKCYKTMLFWVNKIKKNVNVFYCRMEQRIYSVLDEFEEKTRDLQL